MSIFLKQTKIIDNKNNAVVNIKQLLKLLYSFKLFLSLTVLYIIRKFITNRPIIIEKRLLFVKMYVIAKKHKNIEKYPFIIIVGKKRNTMYLNINIKMNVINKLIIVGFIII